MQSGACPVRPGYFTHGNVIRLQQAVLDRGEFEARGDNRIESPSERAEPLAGGLYQVHPPPNEIARRERRRVVGERANAAAACMARAPRCVSRAGPEPRIREPPRCRDNRPCVSKGGTRFATLRATNSQPGLASKITSGETRLSQQPITMTSGACPSRRGSRSGCGSRANTVPQEGAVAVGQTRRKGIAVVQWSIPRSSSAGRLSYRPKSKP